MLIDIAMEEFGVSLIRIIGNLLRFFNFEMNCGKYNMKRGTMKNTRFLSDPDNCYRPLMANIKLIFFSNPN